jgi:hypothetical protein
VIRLRDARGRFVNRTTWEALYAAARQPVPRRIGRRNAVAPEVREALEPGRHFRALREEWSEEEEEILQDYYGLEADWDEVVEVGTEFELSVKYPKE